VYVFVAFPEPQAAPDRLMLNFVAQAIDVPVKHKCAGETQLLLLDARMPLA
jgi:hypothetical protein